MKKSFMLSAILSLSVLSFAQTVPESAFFGGLGGSFAIADFSEVDANTLGLSEVFVNGNKVTTGNAKGPYEFPPSSENKFAPFINLGYFQKFNKSNWLWGSRLNYSYIGTTSTSSEQEIPQAGSNSTGTAFEGVAVVQSFQYSMNHQFTLTPYAGISSGKAFFYIGAGPTLSETVENINGVVGYAFVQGQTVNISGEPADFSSTNWVWGIAVLGGGTYFLTPALFLDLSFMYNPTENQTNDFTAPFSNTSGIFSTSGELIGRTSTSETTYSFTLTINKIF
jgi:hypothetical protein